MRKPRSVQSLTEFGRERLSKSFFMRDFLFSEIASVHGLANIPDDPGLAVAAGRRLCQELLEPIQDAFGRIAVRSAFRSSQVNELGSRTRGYNCAANERNLARHIWDVRDRDGFMGATACVVVPGVWDRFQRPGVWRKLAWWIHDTLPYSALQFFPRYWAFNVSWHERPLRRIDSFLEPKGCLTRPGMANHGVGHRADWEMLFSR